MALGLGLTRFSFYQEFDFASVDATPNYMCTPEELFNIKAMYVPVYFILFH